MASREYSTWKRRPSGEKVLIPRSGGVSLSEVGEMAGELTVFRSGHKHLGGVGSRQLVVCICGVEVGGGRQVV